jgi:hypothetical protein
MTSETKKLDIRVGGLYNRRDGSVAHIAAYFPNLMYCYRDDQFNRYTIEGQYDGFMDHGYDLIKAYTTAEKQEIIMTTSEARESIPSWPFNIPSPTEAPPIPRQLSTPPVASNRVANKHAEIITKWAQGYPIEYRGPDCVTWYDLLPPGRSAVTWADDVEYRVKIENVTQWFGLLDISGSIRFTTGYNSKADLVRAWSPDHRIKKALKLVIYPPTHTIVEQAWENL